MSAKKPGHAYSRPEPPERILLSGHHNGETCDPHRVSSDADGEFVQWVIDKLQHRVPPLIESELVRGYSGVYSNTPDKDFIIDEPSTVSSVLPASPAMDSSTAPLSAR